MLWCTHAAAQTADGGCGTVETDQSRRDMLGMMESGQWEEARFWLGGESVRGVDAMVAMTMHVIRYDNGSEGLPQDQVDQCIVDLNSEVELTGLLFFQEGPTIYHDDSDLAESVYDDFCTIVNTGAVANTVNCYFIPVYVGLCGVASFPSSGCQGVTVANGCAASDWNHSTFTHEVGHYFNLRHTHSTLGGDECVDGSNCASAGDGFCDTPADPKLTDVVDWNTCDYLGTEQDACGSGMPYDPDTTNIMSYSTKLCRTYLSTEQQSMVEWTALNNEHRTDELRDPGACCIDQSCSITAESACAGTWQGAFTDCFGDPCGEPTGGCCAVADCSVSTEDNCRDANGTWLGDGTNCDGEPCGTSEPFGACCIDFTCSITVELQCSGAWLGKDTTCDDDPCAPVGACCVGDVCSITKLDDCGGTWQGAETNCDQNPCIDADPSGACCYGSDCSLTTELGCSGDWQGEGTDCTVNLCEDYLLVPDEFPTIQEAIASASDGDVILVSPGTYTATDLDLDSEVIDTSGLSIEIRSTEGPESTIIDGQNLRPVVVCTQSETADTIINGFTITGGASSWGGGIFCRSSSPTFTNCIITYNMAAERGGGVYLYRADPTFNECTWTANESDTGGGLYSSISNPVLNDCLFEDNVALITGGAIHAAGDGEPVISESIFCHNLPNDISGDWTDAVGNSMLDECEGCSGDIGTLDDVVDQYDLQTLLELWGTDGMAGDIDGDGTVGVSDLLIMLVNWGQC